MYRTGDLLKVNRGFYDHYCAVLRGGDDRTSKVIDIELGRGPEIRTIQQFASGGVIELVARRDPADAFNVFRRAATELMHKRAYDLVDWNCEHLARHVSSGAPHSTQVGPAVAALVFGAISALTYVAQRPSYDYQAARYRSRDGRFRAPPIL